MKCPRSWVALAFLMIGCDSEAETLRAGDLLPDPQGLIGESVVVAQPCEWPTAVVLGAGGCSGVLVHPQVVMTAAHCIGGSGPSEIRFGENAGMPARTVATTLCERNPDSQGVSSIDYAYCTLAEPVDMAIAPPLLGCELDWLQMGQPFVTVGWGSGDGGGGIKRYAPTAFVGWNMDMIAASVDPNELCGGDSGGPTYVKLPDGSWRLVGVSSGGPVGQNPGCIDPVLIVPAANAIVWIEQQTGIDISPCHLGDGTWDASPECTGFVLDPEVGGAWANGTCPDMTSGPAQTCGPSFEQAEESEPPTVTITMPSDGAQYPGTEANIDIEISASDADGVAVMAVELSVNGSVAASDSVMNPIDEPSTWVFPNAVFQAGQYTLTATATDYWGNVGNAEPVNFVVGDVPSDESGDGDTTEDTGADETTDEGSDDTTSGADEVGTEEEESGGGMLDEGGEDGCSCAAPGERSGGVASVVMLLGLLGLRRRRSGRASSRLRC